MQGLSLSLLLALLALMPLAGCHKPASPAPAALARVNGEAITQQDVDQEQRAMALPLTSGAAVLLAPAGSEGASALLEQLIDERLMLQRAAQLKLAPPAGLLQKDVQEARGGLDDAAWGRCLAAQGLDARTFELLLLQRWLLQAVAQVDVYDKVPVSGQELRDYYWEHLAEFRRRERRHLLMISTPALSEAQKAQQELGLGEPFTEVAKRWGKGPEAAQGGDLGFLSAAELPKPLAKLAFSQKKGHATGIVHSAYGYHLLLPVEVAPPVNLSFEEAGDQIRRRLKQSKGQELWQTWLFQLRKAARIERAPSASKG